MNTSLKRLIVPASSALTLVALLIAFYRGVHRPAPPFLVPGLPVSVPRLSTAEAQEVLRGNFELVHRVQQVPTAVMDDYSAVTHQPFWMVNTGQQVSTDAIIPGVPNKQLVLVGLSGRTDVVFYTEFGLFSVHRLMVFSHKDPVGVWEAEITDHSVDDIAGLRIAMQKGEFKSGQ